MKKTFDPFHNSIIVNLINKLTPLFYQILRG
nr:MAG TPA: hypothetical protein [Caudoviricetes sp.]